MTGPAVCLSWAEYDEVRRALDQSTGAIRDLAHLTQSGTADLVQLNDRARDLLRAARQRAETS